MCENEKEREMCDSSGRHFCASVQNIQGCREKEDDYLSRKYVKA